MKVILKSGSVSTLQDDDGTALLEVVGGTTSDAALVISGAIGPMFRYLMTFEDEDDDIENEGASPDDEAEDEADSDDVLK